MNAICRCSSNLWCAWRWPRRSCTTSSAAIWWRCCDAMPRAPGHHYPRQRIVPAGGQCRCRGVDGAAPTRQLPGPSFAVNVPRCSGATRLSAAHRQALFTGRRAAGRPRWTWPISCWCNGSRIDRSTAFGHGTTWSTSAWPESCSRIPIQLMLEMVRCSACIGLLPGYMSHFDRGLIGLPGLFSQPMQRQVWLAVNAESAGRCAGADDCRVDPEHFQ